MGEPTPQDIPRESPRATKQQPQLLERGRSRANSLLEDEEPHHDDEEHEDNEEEEEDEEEDDEEEEEEEREVRVLSDEVWSLLTRSLDDDKLQEVLSNQDAASVAAALRELLSSLRKSRKQLRLASQIGQQLAERNEDLTKEVRDMRAQMESLSTERNQLQQRQRITSRTIAQMTKEAQTAQSELLTARASSDVDPVGPGQAAVATVHTRPTRATYHQSELGQHDIGLRAELDKSRQDVERLRSQLAGKRDKLKQAKEANKDLSEQLEALHSEINKLKTVELSRDQLERQIKHARGESQKLQGLQEENLRLLHIIQDLEKAHGARLDNYEELQRRFALVERDRAVLARQLSQQTPLVEGESLHRQLNPASPGPVSARVLSSSSSSSTSSSSSSQSPAGHFSFPPSSSSSSSSSLAEHLPSTAASPGSFAWAAALPHASSLPDAAEDHATRRGEGAVGDLTDFQYFQRTALAFKFSLQEGEEGRAAEGVGNDLDFSIEELWRRAQEEKVPWPRYSSWIQKQLVRMHVQNQLSRPDLQPGMVHDMLSDDTMTSALQRLLNDADSPVKLASPRTRRGSNPNNKHRRRKKAGAAEEGRSGRSRKKSHKARQREGEEAKHVEGDNTVELEFEETDEGEGEAGPDDPAKAEELASHRVRSKKRASMRTCGGFDGEACRFPVAVVNVFPMWRHNFRSLSYLHHSRFCADNDKKLHKMSPTCITLAFAQTMIRNCTRCHIRNVRV
eukprot:g27093.t1